MVPNHQYFIVRIDKKAQAEKRNKLTMPERATLGVYSADKDKQPKGVIIDRIEGGSPAEREGLSMGDKIVAFNGTAVEDFQHLTNLVLEAKPGDSVRIDYISHLLLKHEDRASLGYVSTKNIVLGGKKIAFTLAPQNEMQRNLQYGEIMAIGSHAARVLPAANEGDILLFHHTVEFKPREEGESEQLYNDRALVGMAGNGDEYRLVDADSQTFGVLNLEDMQIHPHQDYIFCHHEFKKAGFQMKNGIWMPEAWEMRMEDFRAKLEELEQEYQVMAAADILQEKTTEKNYRSKEDIMGLIAGINKEREQLAKEMNKTKLVDVKVLFINPATFDILGVPIAAGDRLTADYSLLYPLQFAGLNYVLARPKYVEMLLPKEEEVFE